MGIVAKLIESYRPDMRNCLMANLYWFPNYDNITVEDMPLREYIKEVCTTDECRLALLKGLSGN